MKPLTSNHTNKSIVKGFHLLPVLVGHWFISNRKLLALVIIFSTFSQIALMAQSPLCQSYGQSQHYEWVTRVKIHDGERTSSKVGYQDFTASSISTLTAGQTYNIEVDVRTNGVTYNEYVKIWFDLNQDNIIQDPGELVYNQSAYVNTLKTFTGTITIPTTAFNGIMYGRMIMQYAAAPALCGPYTYGTTYDVKANILGGSTNPENRTLTVSMDGSGTGNVTSSPAGINTSSGIYSFDFSENTIVTLNAAPAEGSTFSNWTGGVEGVNASVNVTMDADKNITANFALATSLPNVNTAAISDITQTTATVGGTVISDGNALVTSRGVVWNTTGSPTIGDNKSLDGSGTGSFSSLLNSLSPNTTYYVRAYATNSVGTAYGDQIIFKTSPSDPTSILASPASVCVGSSTQLTANGVQGTVHWYTESCGGMSIGTGSNIIVSPTATTTYYARNNNGSFSSGCAAYTVVVNALPTANLSGNPTICVGSSTDLNLALTGIGPWTVGYSDGTTSSTLNIAASDVTSGVYSWSVSPGSDKTYTLTSVSDANCNGTLFSGSAIVTVNEPPVLTVPTIEPKANGMGQCGALVDFLATASGEPTPTIVYSILIEEVEEFITSPYTFPVGTTTVKATATNDCGNDSKTFTVTVADDEAPMIASVTPISTGTDAGVCSASVSFATTVADNCDASIAPVFTLANGTVITSPYVFPEGPTTVNINASDAAGNAAAQQSFTVTVINQLPDPVNITASTVDPIQINTGISTSASFTDNNVVSATWNWGDGNSSVGTISGASVSGSHTYITTGVYTVTLTLTDACSESVTSAPYQYVVVYDPAGGFVTGGGWIESPAEAYKPDPTLVGRANFGFVSKYQKGATIPSGHTNFQFQVANLHFTSTSYEWLVISGATARYKGEGTINGSGWYGFILSATDGQVNGGDGDGFDKFRIKIWDKNNGDLVVYDNNLDYEGEDAFAETVIAGGSIVVHDGSKKNSTNSRLSFGEEGSELIAGFKMYPNPLSQEGLWLEFPAMAEAQKYQAFIYDLSGRALVNKVFEVQEQGAKHLWEINHSEWANGIYMLIIQGKEGTQQLKLMK